MQPADKGRRRHVRVHVRRLTLEFRRRGLLQVILFFRNRSKTAPVVDCSDGGLQMVVGGAIERDTPVRLRMCPAFLPLRLALKGKVSHCRRHVGPKGHTAYKVGVELLRPGRDYLQMVKRLRADPTLG